MVDGVLRISGLVAVWGAGFMIGTTDGWHWYALALLMGFAGARFAIGGEDVLEVLE